MIDAKELDKLDVRPTVVDRLVSYLSPDAGIRRLHARTQLAIAGQWVGASRSKPSLKAWNPITGDADADTLDDLATVQARSRDAIRNQPIALGAIRTNVTSVVGPGLQCRPAVDATALGLDEDEASAWEQNTRKEFDMWASSVFADVSHQQSFYEQQGMCFLSFLEGGDCFALTPMTEQRPWPYRLQIQLIEADRVDTPGAGHIQTLANGGTISGGIERDRFGRFVAVHINRTHPGARRGVANVFDRYPVYGAETGRVNVIHIHDPKRIGQSRGMPYLAPVIEVLKQLTRYSDAELAAAVVSAMFTVFVRNESGMGFGGVGAATGESGQTAASGQQQFALGNAAVVELGMNQSIDQANPMRPNTAFDAFFVSMTRQIGVALELPHELLIKHFSSSYTAARASMQEAWRYFVGRRLFFSRRFCQPVYELFLDDAVSSGRIVAPGWFDDDPRLRHAWSRSKWIGPPRGQINERLETESALRRVDGGLSTLDEETAQATGGDWETNHRQRVVENQARADGGLTAEGAPQLTPGEENP